MNEEQQEEIVAAEPVVQSTAHDHYYEAAGVNENGLLDVICVCGHGMQVDIRTTVVEGKLIAHPNV